MRRRKPYIECRCLPSGVVTHLSARLLKEIVNREIHPIRCAASCRQKYMKGLRIGDLCAQTGHFWWALKVWRYTANLIESKDYDDWRHVTFYTNWVRLRDVISETEYEHLLRRQDHLWRALGHPEAACWDTRAWQLASRCFGTSYTDLFADKYEGWNEDRALP